MYRQILSSIFIFNQNCSPHIKRNAFHHPFYKGIYFFKHAATAALLHNHKATQRYNFCHHPWVVSKPVLSIPDYSLPFCCFRVINKFSRCYIPQFNCHFIPGMILIQLIASVMWRSCTKTDNIGNCSSFHLWCNFGFVVMKKANHPSRNTRSI